MTGKTHLTFNAAVIALLFATNVISTQNITSGNTAMIGGIVLGGILPDIDSPNSTIRHKIRHVVVPKGFRRFASRAAMASSSFNHRKNCTHWPLFWLAACAVLYTCLLTIQPWRLFFAGVAIGAMAHLFCDMFNPYGVMVFAPFSHSKFSLAKIPTNSIGEFVFLFASILTAGALLWFAFRS